MFHAAIYSEYDRVSGYKYLITQGALPWTAFKTEKGWERFLSITGLAFQETETRPILFHENEGQDLTLGTLTGPEIVEKFFYDVSEIPKGSISYTGLCNGGLVTCYASQSPEKTTIFRPNPNAKNVYNPLPLKAQIAFSKEMG